MDHPQPEDVPSSLLLAAIDTLDAPPHHLASPIAVAATHTLHQLRILLVSPLFNPENQGGVSHTGQWDEVQRLLTYVYVQATKVAQEMDKVLMDIDVLLKGSSEPLPESLPSHAQRIFRVRAVSPQNDALANLPPSFAAQESKTVWLAPSEHHPPHTPHPPTRPPHLHPTDSPLPSLFPVVALGGTFDHLHAGHKILLSMAAWIASTKLIVGITDDALLANKANRDVLESLPERIARVRGFLALFKPGLVYDVVPISDVYGPTAWDPNIQALVVSKETLPGAASIDKLRREKALPPLKTFVIDVISSTEASLDHDDLDALKKTKMSSTFIREWIVQQRSRR